MPYANPDRQRASWADAQARRRAKAKADAERAAVYESVLRDIATDPPLPAEQAQRLARAALRRIAATTTDPAARETAEDALKGNDQ